MAIARICLGQAQAHKGALPAVRYPVILAWMPHPRIHLHNNDFALSGAIGHPVPLWDIQSRLEAAAMNVVQAQTLPMGTTPILLGVEHLAFLHDWPDRPVVVIEKCAAHFHEFQETHASVAAPTDCIHVCVGEWGISSPLHFENVHALFHVSEIGTLAFQLMALPDAIFDQVAVSGLPEHSWEEECLHYLHRTIHTVARIKQFHLAHATDYATYRQRPATRMVAVLLRQPDERLSVDKEFGRLIPETDRRFFSVALAERPNFWAPFDAEPPTARFRDPGSANEALTPFLDRAERLWQFLQGDRPHYVAVRNVAPFSTMEEVLVYREMLFRLEIPVYAFFRDLFNNMIHAFEGGGFFTRQCARYEAQTTLFSHEAYGAMLYRPGQHPVYHYPYRYLQPSQHIAHPVLHATALERDVAIIHRYRAKAVACNEINELYELVTGFAAGDGAAAAGRFAYRLHVHLQQHAAMQSCPAFWQVLRNLVDWIFYSQQRIRNVLAIVPRLSHHRLTVFGDGWEQILPPALCGGPLREEAVDHVYRTSGVTINCTATNTVRLPHSNAVRCLAAGGLPLVPFPMFGDPKETGHEFFTDATLPYYRSAEELETMVQHFLQHWDDRKAFITNAQQGWLRELHGNRHKQSLDALRQTALALPTQVPTTITDNPATDAFLLQAALGYFWSFSGYVATALHIWKAACAGEHRHLPLALRALTSAVEIQDWPHARHFLGLARNWAPDDPRVTQFSQRLRGLAGC